jgi:molybdopterin converting factor small subunit
MRYSLSYCLLVLVIVWGVGAHAQQQPPGQDMCAGPLPYQADALVDQRFRLQCSIQKLIAERADAENRATAAEVQTSVEAAHAKAQTDALDAANKKSAETSEYWKLYVEGADAQIVEDNEKIKELSTELSEARKRVEMYTPRLTSAVDASCSWRGALNEPTARMCRLWQKR